MELSAIWVVVIVLIGIAIGVYSICKGCQGLREQSAQALAQLQERTSNRNSSSQRNGTEANNGDLFRISGSRVYDKNPPNYDEIMEPPPSYEETIKLHGGQTLSTTLQEDETAAQVNYACTGCDDEISGPSNNTCPTTSVNLTSAEPPSPPPPLYSPPTPPPPLPVASCSLTINS